MSPPLFVTDDQALLDELLRLAAGAGVTPDVARDPGSALRGWSEAPLVLLGADLTATIAQLCPSRRRGVHIVLAGPTPHELFREALAVGAENVTELPGSAEWVSELLTDLGDAGRTEAPLVGVVGGSGGAGATTFACALGQVASRTGTAMVVDLDPLGPGIDRVLGLDHTPGVGWDALCTTSGRLGSRALREAVPRREGLGALAWRASAPATLQAFAVRESLSAARRGHDLVVVDLPRSADALVDEVVARCELLLIVARPTVSGIASATKLASRHRGRTGLKLVLRGHGVGPDQVSTVTKVPVLATMPDQRGLAESIDLGLGPVRSRRGPLGRAAQQVLAQVSARMVAA